MAPPGKKSFRCPCVRVGVRALLTSRTVSKVSGAKDDDMFFNGFSSFYKGIDIHVVTHFYIPKCKGKTKHM